MINILSTLPTIHHVIVRAFVLYSMRPYHRSYGRWIIAYVKPWPLLVFEIQSYFYTLQHALEYGKCGICKTWPLMCSIDSLDSSSTALLLHLQHYHKFLTINILNFTKLTWPLMTFWIRAGLAILLLLQTTSLQQYHNSALWRLVHWKTAWSIRSYSSYVLVKYFL